MPAAQGSERTSESRRPWRTTVETLAGSSAPKAWAATAATPLSTPMPSSMGEIIILAPRPPAASSAAPSRPTITLSTKTVAIWDRKAIAIGKARPRFAPASSIQVARPPGRTVAPAVMTIPES